MGLSIIIPCKNEAENIGKLLDSLAPLPNDCEIIVADANSTDKTLEVVSDFIGRGYPIKVVKGGLPSVGRNNGAKIAKGDTLLFMDADCYLKSKTIIAKSLEQIDMGYDLVGAFISIENNIKIRIIYMLANLSVIFSQLDKPFVYGGYFMITKQLFNELGGFDETLMHLDDYNLSKKVNTYDFAVVHEYFYTGDRRFKKMGIWGFIKYFMGNILRRNNKEYFKKDIGYWK